MSRAISASSSIASRWSACSEKTGADDSFANLLADQKIDISDAIEDETFRTIVKTRIIARHQQVVRVDREQLRWPVA